MSRKNKLLRFEQISSYSNVYQNFNVQLPALTNYEGNVVDLKGKWHEHFKNDNPIVLELACGKGEYTVGMSRINKEVNYIGVDIKGARIWRGAKTALEEGLENAAFLRTRIEQLDLFFDEGEIDEIWIIFPDPFLRTGKIKKRLTSSRFLKTYKKVLKPDGIINLKTDEPILYDFTLETIEEEGCQMIYHNDDIYSKALYREELAIKTFYEAMHLKAKKTIKYVCFKLAADK